MSFDDVVGEQGCEHTPRTFSMKSSGGGCNASSGESLIMKTLQKQNGTQIGSERAVLNEAPQMEWRVSQPVAERVASLTSSAMCLRVCVDFF